MKTQDILKALKANKKINDFELVVSKKESRELFYVLKNLEINRATNIDSAAITIYVDVKDKRGSSIIAITSSDNVASLNKKLNEGVKKAKSALNPYYPLVDKTENLVTKCDIKENLNKIALNVGNAIFKADVYENGWINSTEVFVTKTTKTFINSKGVKHVNSGLNVAVEVIPTWSNGKEEFELYKWFEQAKPDYALVTKEVEEILNLAKNRSVAKKLQEVKIPKDVKVLVQGDMLQLLAANFAQDISYAMMYYKMNHYEKGSIICNNDLDITLKGVDKKCVESCPFDEHGFVLKNKKVISKGKVVSNWGDVKNAYYLKQKPTGNFKIVELKGKAFDYTNEKHIIVCNFSSPQLDEASGYWGGEVRLAMYFDGKKYTPITNFSIAGNIYKDALKMQVSKEQVALSDYVGPKYLIFEGLNIF